MYGLLLSKPYFTPSKDPPADTTMDAAAATDDEDGLDMSPIAAMDPVQECLSLGYLDEYRLDRPANTAYHTAFKGIMSTVRHFQFLGDTQWAVSAVTAHLPECVYLTTPPGTVLITAGDPGWLGLVLQGHTEAVPGAPNLTGDLKIFGAESLEPGVHQQPWVAVVETTFLAIPHAVTETIHRESVGYAADKSSLLQTVIHNQLGSLTQMRRPSDGWP